LHALTDRGDSFDKWETRLVSRRAAVGACCSVQGSSGRPGAAKVSPALEISPRFCLYDGVSTARSGLTSQDSAATSVLLAVLLVLLVASTAYVVTARLYPAPAPISATAVLVDRQYDLTLYATGAAFILAQLGLAYTIVRFRDRGQKARFSRGHVRLEILWTSVTLLVFIGLGILGRRAWADVRFVPAGEGAIQVEATTSQFVYIFRYPGADGKFGRLDPALVNAPAGNPLGIDPRDPAGKDDIVVAELTVPVNQPVELLLRSQDVIHNFFVRELRLQQDAVPGMLIPVRFTASRIGTYEIVCTQLCGLGHSKMHSLLRVVSSSDYVSFLKRESSAP
jgi:cytochrome c oxidase subunit II